MLTLTFRRARNDLEENEKAEEDEEEFGAFNPVGEDSVVIVILESIVLLLFGVEGVEDCRRI